MSYLMNQNMQDTQRKTKSFFVKCNSTQILLITQKNVQLDLVFIDESEQIK